MQWHFMVISTGRCCPTLPRSANVSHCQTGRTRFAECCALHLCACCSQARLVRCKHCSSEGKLWTSEWEFPVQGYEDAPRHDDEACRLGGEDERAGGRMKTHKRADVELLVAWMLYCWLHGATFCVQRADLLQASCGQKIRRFMHPSRTFRRAQGRTPPLSCC